MILGCIADDFTGASDAASFLVKGGMRTILFNGIPEQVDPAVLSHADAVVIALKTRTQETASAVADSLSAIRWLEQMGAVHFYVKYCSTFDSTPEGNIGPICDAVMEELDVTCTLLCPSLPINGRTVENGILYVNGVRLEESHMKNHPLTPMHESFIPHLMAPQSKYSCIVVTQQQIEARQERHNFTTHGYLVPDYRDDEDAETIIRVYGKLKLLTGGSGLLTPWARYLKGRSSVHPAFAGNRGASVLLAGSCSRATLAQIAWFKKKGGCTYKLDPQKLLDRSQTLADAQAFIREHEDEAVLVYSSETPAYLEAIRGDKLVQYSRVLEESMAGLAGWARDTGIRHIIVAGGETSGAVTKALGYQAYWIGPSIAPGVPMMMPLDNPTMRLVLKSGNFGQEDFFGQALALCEEK
ncbi:3-oxo-tetronate kinase [Mitsuokella multacida]|uniref:3-oxo-tetronate kinase n=1 Tax=Mitsuokella multacida TaxID=52226 RepID=UPI0026651FB3|nr:3-oxo-tetronate kinase [Mitsuokella multacida]